MLITLNRVAVVGLSSTLSFAIWSLPPCSAAISSSTGAIMLQGPHHSAQKSTSTGLSALPMVSSKVWSVSFRMSSPRGRPFWGVGRVYEAVNTDPGPGIPEARPVVRIARRPRGPAPRGQRSASIAAMQPLPAAVIAWR